jgi:hypothetical protein
MRQRMTAAPSPVFGERFAAKQSGDNLAVIRPGRETTVVTSFARWPRAWTRVPGALCQGDAETIEVGAREGDAVVLTVVGSISPGGGAVMKRDVRRVFRLQSPDTLIVEGRMAVQGELRPVATVYRRSTETMPEPTAATATQASGTIAQVAWISGVWIGTAGQTTVEERWTPVAGGSIIGVARTLERRYVRVRIPLHRRARRAWYRRCRTGARRPAFHADCRHGRLRQVREPGARLPEDDSLHEARRRLLKRRSAAKAAARAVVRPEVRKIGTLNISPIVDSFERMLVSYFR